MEKELIITSMTHEGRGVARLADKVCFVFGALPGESVKAKITRTHRRYDEAIMLEVNNLSPSRITPCCPYFGFCGGCQLQHVKASAQMAYKQAFLEEQILHQANITPGKWLAPLMGKSEGYRHKARLGVRYVEKKQALLIGFREQKSNKITDIDVCQILDPRIGLNIKALRALVEDLEARDDIAQIEVAIGEEGVALVFRHLIPLSEKDEKALIDFCQDFNFLLYCQSGGVETVRKVWPLDSNPLLSYTLRHQQLRYYFHPLDFTQVNPDMNQKMIDQALVLLAPTASDLVLDLFCGIGNFSLPFAQRAVHVTGIEGSMEMVKRAKSNAEYNHLKNLSFYVTDLNQANALAPFATKPYSKIILDPPRSGAQVLIPTLCRFKAKAILYISCNPATFARDAGVFAENGYRLTQAGVMDMFPHTAHVEVMGLFEW